MSLEEKMQKLQELISARDAFDEQITIARAEVAQEFERVRALLGEAAPPVVVAVTQPKPSPRNDPDQTDFSAGIGRDVDDDISVEEFRAELAELKDITREKRRRFQ